jgi:hypothetical protein
MKSIRLSLYLTQALLLISLLGAGPLHASRYHVKPTGNDMNNGTSWTLAFQSLQKALDVAVSGDEVWVAACTYKPTNLLGTRNDPMDNPFQLFPNPTKGQFTLRSDLDAMEGWTYSICDPLGRILTSGQLSQMETHISLQGQSTGLYHVHIQNHEGKHYLLKLMKQ